MNYEAYFISVIHKTVYKLCSFPQSYPQPVRNCVVFGFVRL